MHFCRPTHPFFMPMSALCFLALLLTGAAGSAAGADAKRNVLIVTGGHGFKQEPFFRMFKDNAEITFTHAEHAKTSATAYERDDLFSYDAVVLYDMPQRITAAQQARFLSLFEKGVGLVVLHHALVSYQQWPDYERIIGGRYQEPDASKPGTVTEQTGWKHDEDIPVVIAAKNHPITAGLNDFTIHDEIYWGFRVGSGVTPLITTAHPKSGKPLGWFRAEGKSRVVFIQLGHGPEAFGDANYRKLLAQSIRWVADSKDDSSWVSVFDGQTLNGWVQRGGKAEYRVEAGQIVGRCVPNTPNSFLCTQRQFTNFVLELEFKVDDGLNSGVQVRSHCFDQPTEFEWKGRRVRVPAGRVHGLQVEVDTTARAWSGGVYEEGARGWLNDLKNNEPARQAFKGGEWNKYHIECKGDSIKTWINDVPAADLKDDRVTSGFIGLQVHGVGKREKTLEVRFRNVRVKEL